MSKNKSSLPFSLYSLLAIALLIVLNEKEKENKKINALAEELKKNNGEFKSFESLYEATKLVYQYERTRQS